MNEKTTLGMDARLEAALGYIAFLGFIWLFVEKDSEFVREHATQATALLVVSIAASIVAIIPIVGWIVGGLVNITVAVLWVICVIYAATGKSFEVPFIGAPAKQILGNLGR